MSTYNAIMQIQVDTSDANKRLAEVDKNLTSIRSTSSETSSSLKRLEGTFTRIEKTMASVDRTMRGVFSVMKIMSKANLSLNGSFQTLNKSVTGIDKNVSKFSSNIHLLSKRYANLQNKVNDLNRELRKLKSNAGSADSALSKTEKSLEKGSGTLDLFNKKIKISGYLFTVLAQAALNFIQTNIVGYLIRATDQFILLENRIRLVNDSITTFNVNMKSAASVALETRQNLFAVGNLMARVGRNSKELAANSRELAQVTSTVSKSFIIAGATAEEARNAIVQLSQALASGRLQGDELRSILELAPTLAQSISKSIGITVGELRSFASEGLITTKIIVSAMLESTSEINEAFSKMQPTVSQALETLRTSMQVTLGSVDSFKDANFSLAMSFTKLGAIIRNMLGSEALAGLGEVLDKIAQNIIPLIAGFTTFVGVLLTLTGVSYGVSKAITAIQVAISAGPGGLLALLIRLGVVIASFVAAKKVFDGMSSSMGFLSSQTRSYSKVVEDTAKEIEGLEKKTGKALDETEKLTIEYRNLALELSQINLAIQELEKEQKKVQNNLISLESDTKTFFRKISYVVESVVKMILASILNLANIVATSIIDSFIGMVEVAARSADWISQNFGLDIFSGAVASVQNLRAEFRKMMGDARRANVEMFDPFGGGITDAIMGKQPFGTDKKREAEIDAQLALEKAKREEFEAQMKKLEEERAEKARDLFLKSFEAQIQASKNLVDVQAKEMRKIFELQFSKPFDLRFTPAQQALSDFATSFTQDMQKEIEKRVPESKVDLTKFFDLESAGSPFKAENLFQIVKDLKKNIDSNFKFSEEEVKNIFNLDRIIDTIFNDESIKKKVEEAGEKSILRDLFTGSATSLLYKNAEKLAQELINIELNFAKQMAEMERSYGIDDKKSKLMIKINKDQIKSLESNSGYREQILESTRQQSVLEANIILERMASEGFDKARLERAKELLDIQTENLVVLREQEIAIEAARDKRALQDEVKLKVRDNFLLEAEVSLYKQAISPIERVKKLQEEKDKVEENILRNQLIQKGYTNDQVDAIAEILKNKQYQLNKEQEISKELEYQKELQKSEQDLAKEQLLAQTRAFIAAKKNAMSLAEQFSIATGAKADPFSGMEERISKEFDIYISQDIPEYMLQFKEGVLGVADEFRDKMTDEEKERLERARELVSIQDQINEQQKKFYKYTEGFFDSLTLKLGQSLKDFGIQKGGMREVRKAGGGMLSGPSHANGGINGVLYGQGIELEGGEYVISKDAVAKYGVPLFDALNAKKFQGGGLMAGSYGKSPSAGEAATARANLAVSSMAASMVAHQFEEMSYSMKALKETTDELSESNKTGIASVDSLAEKYKDAPVYGQPGTGSPAGMTDDTKIAIENLTKAVETNTEVEQLAASKDDDSFTAKAKSLYNTVMAAVNDPVTAALNLTYDALLQNERFQKVQERFMTLVYSAFDGIAEGLAIFFEALLDAVEPLRPILEMIGDTFKGLFRGLTRVIQPFARLIESITPILIYISGFLQLLVGLISSIFGIIGATIDGIFSAIINGLGIETSEDKYKSLNLLRQERDIISEINTSISGLGETLKEIQDVIFEIMNSALNIAAPGVKLDLAAEKYNELYAAATAIGADEDAIQDYQNFTKVYLQQAQDVLKTSSAYQQIYVQVIDDLQSLQEASAAAVGADITEALKKGIFDLQVAGSPMGDMISDAVEVYRNGYISYNDLLTYIGYKLAQIGQDIDLKDFAEFGSIGDFSEVEKAFYEYRDDAVQQWEGSMGAAISSSSIDTDFEKLFGIDYQTGQRIKDAIALQESEMVLAVEQGRANALRKIQPEIGDVTPSDPNFTRDTGTTGGVDFNFDLGIDFDLFGGLVTTLESIFTQLDVPTSFAEFKENWDHWMTQLQLPDLGSWNKFKEWWDGIGFPDLSGDLTEGWNTFKTNWDNLWNTLTLQDVDLDIGGQLQSAVNSVFGDPKSLLDKLRMLKNPFYPAIQPDYLIEFGKGGLLDGPSHDNGGILANVRGRGPIELEGGEYIINKKTVSSLGTGFLSMINGITNKGDLTNAIANIPKFEGGGSTNQDEWNRLNYGGGDNKNKEKETIAKMFDLRSSQYERFGFDVTDSIKNVTDILYVRGTDKDKVTPKRNPKAPSSMSDPMRLIEPQSYMNTFDLFDVEIGTRGWFKSLIGDHGIEASMGFPYGSNFRNWETGGLIPKFEGGGDTYGLQWTGFTSGEVNQFKSYGGQKVTPEKMLAKNRFGSFNETRRADNLQYKEERERMNVDTSFLSSIGVPDYVTGAISSAIDGIIGGGWGLITSSLDLMGTFGANIGNYLTSISALGGLFGGGDASREEWSLGELIMLGIGLTSFLSMFTEMGGGKGMGLTDVGDWIELFSFGNYKKTPGSLADITWAWVPAFLSLAPLFTTDEKYDEKGSVWDWLSITTDNFVRSLLRMRDKGGKDLGDLTDRLGDDALLATLIAYGAYEGAVNLFDLDMPSLFGGKSKSFSFGSNSSSGSSSRFTPVVPNFLSRGNVASRYSSYKGFAKGGRVGGLAVGPSHDSGMLGMTTAGSPFLFEGGEYIMNRNAVSAIGPKNLDLMNEGYFPIYSVEISSLGNRAESQFNQIINGGLPPVGMFGSGGLLTAATGMAVGPSHQSGMLGMTKNGAPFLFEGGEYIISKDAAESIGVENLHAMNKSGSFPFMMGSGGSLKTFRSAGSVSGSWMDTWGKELPKEPDYLEGSIFEDLDVLVGAENRVRGKRSLAFLRNLGKYKKPRDFSDIFDANLGMFSLISLLGGVFPDKSGMSDFNRIERGKADEIPLFNALVYLSTLGYAGTRFYQWWKSGKPVFGGGGELPEAGMGGTFDLFALLFAGETARRGYYGGSPFSEYFGKSTSGRIGDASLSFLVGLLPFILAANNDQVFAGIDNVKGLLKKGNGGSVPSFGLGGQLETIALLYALLGGYTGYKGSQLYGPWTGSTIGDISAGFFGGLLPFFLGANLRALEKGDGGSIPSFGLGGKLETVALLYALLGGYTGYKGSQLYGPWTGSTFGDISAGFLGGLLPFFLGTNINALRGNGGELPEAGIGDYLGWLWPGNWLPDGPKKGSVYYPFMATPYRGVSGSGLLPWNWFDDDIKGPDTSSAARDVWWEALVKYGNIFNWFGNGGSLTEAATGMSLFGLGTAGFGAMSILADAGMLPGNAIFGSPLGSRQNKGSAGSQALTAAQAISWALGSIGLFSSMSGGKRSGEMGLLSLVLMGLGATGFKSGSKNYLNPTTWANTQKYNRSRFGSGGSIPSFGYGGRSGSGMRKFGDSPGLDLLSSLLLMGTFNELYQSQVRKGGGKNNVSMLLQLVGLLGTGLSGYASYKSLTSGNWTVGGKSGSLPYLFKERSMFGSGGAIPSYGLGGDVEKFALMFALLGGYTGYKGSKLYGPSWTNSTFGDTAVGFFGGLLPFIIGSNMGIFQRGSGGTIPSFGFGDSLFGGGSGSSTRRKPTPGLDLLTSLVLMSVSNSLYQEQVGKGSGKNNHSRVLQLLSLLGTGYFAYDSFKSLTSMNWMVGGKSGSLGYLLRDKSMFGSGGKLPSFGQGRGVGSSNVLDWIWPWDTKGSIDSLFDWSSQGIASASMDFLDLGWWGKNFSLWSWLDFGNGGSIPSYKTGDLLDLLGKKRRKSAFENGLFELSAMGDVSRSRVIKGRGKRDDSWGFLNYLMLMLSIGGLGAAIANNKKLFGFGSGGSLQAGGIAKGPSHQSGMVGYARGGMPFLFEGGEYIVRKDSVDKLGVPLLDMLNSGMITMGAGGLLSFQGGTTNYPQTIDQLLLARRDLFGLQKLTKTTEDGGTQDVYVVNPEDIAGLGTSDAKLLEGIQKTLTSLLVTIEEEIPVTDETGVTTMEKQLKISTLALETALGMDISLAKYTSGIFSAVTDEQANALRSAGIEPGMLLRVSLDYLGNVAFAQFASIMAAGRGGGPSFEDELLKIILPAIFESMGATGAAGALGVFGVMYGRETAETGKQDIAVAAGLVAGYLAMGGGGWAVAAAALVAAEVFGKPENYFAEIGIDEQMDLQEPVTGLYDELMNPRDGLLTFPANYFSNIGDEKLPEIQARLDEGMMRMTMNSQKLGAAMERAFGMDEDALQFDMAAGLETTYESVNSLSKIGDRLKELENILAPNVEAIIDGIRYVVEYPAEALKKLGRSIKESIGSSVGELFDVVLGFPLHLVDEIESVMERNISIGVQEFTKNILALFLGIALFPATIMMLVTGKMGETVDQFLLNLITLTGAIALLPVTLTMAIVAANSEFVVKFAESFNSTVLGGILNIPGNIGQEVFDILIPQFFGSFMGVFDSFLGEILMIPNMLLQETINFVTALPARLLEIFGIQFPFFELNALKNPFHGNLGGPEYLIDLEIGEKSEGDGGLINYGKGGVLQTGGLAKGPSHQSGMLGLTNQGTPFLFEGGEYIVNKKTTDLLGHDFMAEVNAISSDKDLKDVFSLLSMFEPGGGLFDLGMNDNPLSSVFTIPNPLKSLTGPDEFNIAIDPSEDLSGIDVEQNLFQKGGGLFDIAGNVFGNSFEKDFLTTDNPFRKAIQVVERYQREVKKYGFLGRVVGTFMEWATRTVTRMVPLGPDELTLGIDGYLLDFYNSKLTSNFGGDVLGKLGIDSLPTPSMKNGGPVFGRSHALGGIIAELEGGEFVINKDSADEMGYEFLSSLNSRGNGSFVGNLVQSSFATNELLGKLISVVEDKDMSVMVVDSSGEERSSSKIKISQDREMSYRGARMLA